MKLRLILICLCCVFFLKSQEPYNIDSLKNHLFSSENNIEKVDKMLGLFSIANNNFNNEINYLINFLKGYYKSRINIKILFWHSKLIERSILSNKINRTKKSYNICLIPNLKKENLINNLNFNFFMGDTDVFININKNN